jgi:hypothetical protein
MMRMRQMIKRYLWMVLLAASLPAAWAFSLNGPVGGGEDTRWQIPDLGFNLLEDFNPINGWHGVLDGPKNLGEEYRCNAPVIYYACDATFLDFFGMSGMTAVEQAFAVLNDLTNVDSFSSDLSEFPLQAQAINYTAQSWGLYDMKSLTMALMMEQIGLADPIRYTWVLHDRFIPPRTACPSNTQYLVVSRNFDLLTGMPAGNPQFYSPYVNATLYSYFIKEYCAVTVDPPTPLLAVAVAENVDAGEEYLNAPVASGVGIEADGVLGVNSILGANGRLFLGGYYLGLTRDDVQGLRYLYSTNNINFESSASRSVLLSTVSTGGGGLGPPFVLYTSNYTAFALFALTNNPVILATLYPGLIVTSSSNYPVVIHTPNIVSYLTNSGVLGNPPVLFVTTNGFTDTVVLYYTNTYANVTPITNSFPTNATTSAQLVTVQVSQGGVLGNSLVTNTTIQSITLNVPSGDFYIPTNSCGITNIIQLPYTNVVVVTNSMVTASNSSGLFYSQSVVINITNHAYWVTPFICAGGGVIGVSNLTGLYQGVGKLQFVQANFDSLIGQYFLPITNTYTMVVVTNFQASLQTFQRVVTAPDFLFSAADLTSGGSSTEFAINAFAVSLPGFSLDTGYGTNAGPGVINPGGMNIVYNKIGPIYDNQGTAHLEGTNDGREFLFASFDGTTNTPIIYPDAASIAKLDAAVLIQVSPDPHVGLPVGSLGVAYPTATITNVTISALGGQSPFTWSLAAGQLPDGLTLSTNGVISGTPTRSGTFYFTIQMNDSSPAINTLNLDYSITIDLD